MTPPVRRVLVCPQELKGTLTAARAAEVIAGAVRALRPDLEVVEQPMADGGPGTASIVGRARGAALRAVTVHEAYGEPVEASFALVEGRSEDDATAVIDSAAAVGLAATADERRAPLRSTSRGVGELLLAAAEAGARSVILGVGGTASSDGGAGAASALGLRLLDANGTPLPDGGIHLARLARIEDGVPAALRALEVRIAVDVQNPLTGAEGAVGVYGAQKGLLDWQAPALDAAVRTWAARVRADLGREVEVPGAGAGGGIPAGILAALPRAAIESGAALVAEAVGLREQVERADLVITGEGSLDAQTAFGKAVAHVTALAAAAGTPCLAVAGTIEARPQGIADAEPLARTAEGIARAIAEPERYLAGATRRLLERWMALDAPPPA